METTPPKLNGLEGQATGLLERATLHPLRQPRNEEEATQLRLVLRDLNAAAAADDHCVLAPTHVMLKGGKIAGYLSLGGLPMVHCWFDSKQGHAGDSLKMIEHGETVLRTQGVREVTVACTELSPFTLHLERLGFKKLGTTVIWRKEL